MSTTCPTCNGTGNTWGLTCRTCDGDGNIQDLQDLHRVGRDLTCRTCDGDGNVPTTATEEES